MKIKVVLYVDFFVKTAKNIILICTPQILLDSVLSLMDNGRNKVLFDAVVKMTKAQKAFKWSENDQRAP